MPIRSLLFTHLLSFSVLACASDDGPSGTDGAGAFPPQGYAWVAFGADTVTAEVADTEDARQQGLMYREQLAEGEGMLFVWTDEAIRSFWMKDTLIPLDVAFLDRAFTVINISQMDPQSEYFHFSDRPAMFALEVPRAWFSSRGIGEGSRASLISGPR